jgi:hypothetical protein
MNDLQAGVQREPVDGIRSALQAPHAGAEGLS